MIWLRWLLITVVIAGVGGGGGYFLYNTALADGELAGYEAGYTEGHEGGYLSGEVIGYDNGETAGYESGKSDGYKEGRSAGYLSGKTDGYQGGLSAGYEQGYDDGIEAGLGHGYTLKDPTYEEVVAFLQWDKTDENEYDLDDYVCSHFARDVCNNAEAAGFRCAFVEIRYSDSGHAIVVFDTIDQGLIYFDPQFDARVRPVIGKRYYQCIEPDDGYYIEPPDHDDTIRDMLIIW